MNTYENLKLNSDDQHVLNVTIDLMNHSVNVFNESLLRDFDLLIREIEEDASVNMVVFRSGKESGFLAGADVHRIANIVDAAEADKVLKLGQDLFQRISNLKPTTVAVLHGPCLGGGLEFALACDHRVARNDSSTRLGLPETQLGLIPGWGGTQRLPRLVGVATALEMILKGDRLSASKAMKVGLVDAIFDAENFESDLNAHINSLLTQDKESTSQHGFMEWLRDDTSVGRAIVFEMTRRQIANKTTHYPALAAAVRAVETGLKNGMEAGMDQERKEFCQLITTRSTHNLLQLFLRREQARNRDTWVSSSIATDRSIKTVGVLGAGTMGAGIAQLAATRGYFVILKDVNKELVQNGFKIIEKLTHTAVEKGAISEADAEQALQLITKTTEDNSLQEADLIIEAIVEQLSIKQEVFRNLDETLPESVIFASNTSALPIHEMAEVTQRANSFAGLHFFNPVHKMPLVEVVKSKQTSEETIGILVDFVRKLGKTPVVVSEGPGFLVNRILFPYLDEAVRMVLEGVPVEKVDRAAKRFGMPMGPLELLDTVGLDVAADVSGTLCSIALEGSPTPKYLEELVKSGKKGRKTEQGFYTYKSGKRGEPLEIKKSIYNQSVPTNRILAGESLSGIQQRLVFAMVNEAANCLHEGIVREPWMVDLAMVLGTGFAPFRGGPMSLIDNWGTDSVINTLNFLADTCGPRFKPSDFFTRRGTPSTDEAVPETPRPMVHN